MYFGARTCGYYTVTCHFIFSMRFTKIIILTIFFCACNNSKHDTTKSESPAIDPSKNVMTDTTKKDILDQINIDIKSGFYDKEEIFTNIEDYLDQIPFDHEWAKHEIDKAYSDRIKEQSTWPAITD